MDMSEYTPSVETALDPSLRGTSANDSPRANLKAEDIGDATPDRPLGSQPSTGRPNRNRERISYSDFYKIGIIKPDPPVRTPAKKAEGQSEKKDKASVLKFRVRNGSVPQDVKPNEAIAKEKNTSQTSQGTIHREATARQTAKTSRQNGHTPSKLMSSEGDNKSELDLPMRMNRDRAASSPLSSVPSDLDEAQETINDDFSLSNPSGHRANKKMGTSQSIKVKRAGGDLDGSKRPSKSRKIKFSSPSKIRRDSPVDLELLPQDAKPKSKLDLDSKNRIRDDDQGSNDGHCSACHGTGKLLCCDDCPRSFHFVCIDPPIDELDIPTAPYFCMSCWDRRYGSVLPEPGLFHSLMTNELTRDPAVFQLPEYIRSFFDNGIMLQCSYTVTKYEVSTGDLGVYQEMKDQKILRKDRHGFAEEPDPFRLRDRHNRPILCYKCGTSAIGTSGIASCDYCSLHWHFDCMDPPLPGPPSAYKKWMCPLHASDLTPTTRRPRESRVVDVSLRRGFQNRGDIEVDVSETDLQPGATPTSTGSDCESDEEDSTMFDASAADMPRIKYRIPARGIVLDFLDSCRPPSPVRRDPDINVMLPRTSSSMQELVDLAVSELHEHDRIESSAEQERVQLLAVKALLQSVGKHKLLKLLKESA